jgi:tetratricopeptide (TPR) repeat protein
MRKLLSSPKDTFGLPSGLANLRKVRGSKGAEGRRSGEQYGHEPRIGGGAGVSVGEEVAGPVTAGVKALPRRAILMLVGGVALAAALAVWVGPRMVSLYQQERGGALLDRALALEGYDTAEASWPVAWGPLVEAEARALAEGAAERFGAAVAADPDHAQARRWAGRAALLLDEPLTAAEAFSAYVRQRPGNPLGYWELGLAYERMARRAEGAVHWAVEPGAPPSDSTFAADAVAASVDAAAVETPDVTIGTPYCDQGEAPESCFVTTTTWWMPDAPRGDLWTPDEEVGRRVLFMHPPAEATFTVTLPVTPTALTFWMGIDPAAHGWLGDGVVYRVAVDGAEVFTHTLTAEEAREGWQEARVDLSAWASEEVQLTLFTGAGRAGDGQGDWSGWGDIEVATRDGKVVPWTWIRAAWEEAGITAQDLIAVGEEARKAGHHEVALRWYELAVEVKPDVGDAWYFAGLVYEERQQWRKALDAYKHSSAAKTLVSVSRSSPHYRSGRIYQWHLEQRQTRAALEAYEEAIRIGDFSTKWEAAGCHYDRGQVLWWNGGDSAEYIAEFEQAIELNPQHAPAYDLLGLAYYATYEDFGRAEMEIKRAIELAPDYKWAYKHLGDIYRQEGHTSKAGAMYEQALEIDPEFESAMVELNALSDE